MSQVKKISVATVYGKISVKELLENGGVTPIMRVIGAAIGSKTGESNYGPYTSLVGQFLATNIETGETSEASILFLPDVALTPILVALSQPDCKGVEFAIEIHAKYVENGKAGGVPYEYSWVPLLPPSDDNPIMRIQKRLLALQAPALQAVQDAQPDAAKSTKPARKAA